MGDIADEHRDRLYDQSPDEDRYCDEDEEYWRELRVLDAFDTTDDKEEENDG